MPETSVRRVYILHGPDDYLRRQRSEQIVARLAGKAQASLAVAGFDASAELSDVLDELRTAPLLARRRVVIVRQADKFVLKHAASLEKYLAGSAGSGTLILTVDSWPPQAPRGKAGAETRAAAAALDRTVRGCGELIDCQSPKAASLVRWIEKTASAQDKRIRPDAARLLARWIGADLFRLDNEIHKLSLYVGSREEISVEDVCSVVVASSHAQPFALTDAIAARDASKALSELSALLSRRGEEIRVLGLIAWHVRRTISRGGRSRGSGARARRGTRHVLAADLALKTGADPLTTMQMLVTRLCV